MIPELKVLNHPPSVPFLAGVLVVLVMLTACEPGPRQVQTGSDSCSYCSMIISEPGFASQVVTQQGRSYVYDSIECLAADRLTQGGDGDEVHSVWVTDFSGSAEWVQVEDAHFLKSDSLNSPMSLSLSAWSSRERAERGRQQFGGRLMQWRDVLEYVQSSWSDQLERLSIIENPHDEPSHHE